jgi:hypothetical protein
VFTRAVTYPLCVTFHVVFAVMNHWRSAPDRFDMLLWPDEGAEQDADASAHGTDRFDWL